MFRKKKRRTFETKRKAKTGVKKRGRKGAQIKEKLFLYLSLPAFFLGARAAPLWRLSGTEIVNWIFSVVLVAFVEEGRGN